MNAPVTSHPSRPTSTRRCFRSARTPTPYRKLDPSDGVRVEKIMGRDMLVVEREALRALAEAAFIDINHLLRPAHLASLKRSSTTRRPPTTTSSSPTIFSRTPTSRPAACCRCARTPAPPSSWARRAGSSSPTATTRPRSPRARATPTSSATCAIRSSRRSRCSRRRTPATNMPAQVEIYAEGEDAYKFLFIAKGGGSANKAFLFQATPSILTHDRMIAFLRRRCSRSAPRRARPITSRS